MSARKLVYKFMVVSPLLMMGGISIHARMSYDPFVPIPSSPEGQAAIDAYATLTKKTVMLLSSHKPSVSEGRELAKMWVAGMDSGKLRAVRPVCFEVNTQEGPVADIFEARSGLGRFLTLHAAREGVRHDPDLAAKDIALVLRLMEVGKYSDFLSIHSSATEQRQSLRELVKIQPQLSRAAATEVGQSLLRLRKQQKSLETTTAHIARLFIEFRSRRGGEPLPIEAVHAVLASGSGQGPGLQARRYRGASLLASNSDENTPRFFSTVWLGTHYQEELLKELDREVGKKTPPLAR